MSLAEALDELWALRDQVVVMDDPDADPVAAQMHTLYNRLLVDAGPAPAVYAAKELRRALAVQ